MGHPLEGRQYKCRTFYVPNRGEKLFMLATECARVLNYRDSYLLFNKNRSLYKIIASQPEKDDLISQEILPYSYRSRQIAIVTAKSMFRQFGSRVIQDGRRVRDDYWEAKARKQGFTEEDAAGEKRPGAAKARDAAAAEAVQNTSVAGLGHPDIIYGSGPLDHNGQPQSLQPVMGSHMPATLAPLPMIIPSDDRGLRDYGTGGTPRPRQEMTGPPYQDRTQPTSAAEIRHQAATISELNTSFNEQRKLRGNALIDSWRRPHEVPVSAPQQPLESSPVATQSLQSPQAPPRSMMSTGQQQSMMQQQSSHMMSPHAYSQQPHPGNPLSQSPRGVPQAMRPEQLQQRSSSLSYAPEATGQGSPYGYAQSSNAWGQPPPQPQQSPISSHPNLSQYSPSHQQSSHPPQSPHQPPQLHHPQSSGSMHGAMGYQNVPGMNPSSYPAMRSMYQQPNPTSQQYMQQTTAGQQAGMQGWAPPPQQGQQPGWPHGYWRRWYFLSQHVYYTASFWPSHSSTSLPSHQSSSLGQELATSSHGHHPSSCFGPIGQVLPPLCILGDTA